MRKFLKKSRLMLAVSMFVQAIAMLVLFITQLARRRSLACAFLAVSTAMAAAGGYLLWQWTEDERDAAERAELAQKMAEDPDGFEIPLDEEATEREFK